MMTRTATCFITIRCGEDWWETPFLTMELEPEDSIEALSKGLAVWAKRKMDEALMRPEN